jgi:hypothetical protein
LEFDPNRIDDVRKGDFASRAGKIPVLRRFACRSLAGLKPGLYRGVE